VDTKVTPTSRAAEIAEKIVSKLVLERCSGEGDALNIGHGKVCFNVVTTITKRNMKTIANVESPSVNVGVSTLTS